MTRIFSRNNARIFDRVLLSKTKIGVHVCNNGISFFFCLFKILRIFSNQVLLFYYRQLSVSFHRRFINNGVYVDLILERNESCRRSRDHSFLSEDREISKRNRIALRTFPEPLGTNTTRKRVSGNTGSDRLGNSRIRSAKQLGL